MAKAICRIADDIAGPGSAHDVHLYCSLLVTSDLKRTGVMDQAPLDLVLHAIFDAQVPLSQVHIWAEEIKRALRQAYPQLDSITIHTEPPEQ